MNTGRIAWSPVYRVRSSTDRSVHAVASTINANAEAIAELQSTVDDLFDRFESLVARVERLETTISGERSSPMKATE